MEIFTPRLPKKVKFLTLHKRRTPIIRSLFPSKIRGQFPLLLFVCLLLTGCPEESLDGLPAKVKNTRVLEFRDKIILRAITSTLKERGYENPKVDLEKGRVETDYVVEGDYRTKVEATVKKIGRNEGEVTLSVTTEEKSSSGWKPKNIMEKAQYDKFFEEIEMQSYREMAKGE